MCGIAGVLTTKQSINIISYRISKYAGMQPRVLIATISPHPVIRPKPRGQQQTESVWVASLQ
jgi:hypothetical protein